MYGLGYSPRQFWHEMSPREVILILRGFRWRQEVDNDRFMSLLAALRLMTSYIVNLWSKEKVQPHKLWKLPNEETHTIDTQKREERIKQKAKEWGIEIPD